MCALIVSSCSSGGSNQLTNAPLPMEQTAPTYNQARPLQARANVKIALLLPLSATGNTAKIAKGLKQAGELALFEFDNPNILLVTKDTKGTPEGAMTAATDAIRDGAEIVIGPLFATSVTAAAPVTRAANVPMIAFSSDESVAGNGVYLLSFLAGKDVSRIVNFAASQGKQKFAALVPQDAYGSIVEATFRQAVASNGGQVLAVARYPRDANGMLAPTKQIAALTVPDKKRPDIVPPGLDAILIPAGPEALPSLSPLMPYFEIDTKQVKLIGTGRWDYANIGREKPMIGGWFPAPDPSGWRDFTQRYVQTYGNVPPRISSLAYDAVSMAVALSSNPKGSRYNPEQIVRPSGFQGVDGLFRFAQNGISERGLAILEVQKFGNRVVDPAPQSFSSPQLMSQQQPYPAQQSSYQNQSGFPNVQF